MSNPLIAWGLVLALAISSIAAHNAWLTAHPGLRRSLGHRAARVAMLAVGVLAVVQIVVYLSR